MNNKISLNDVLNKFNIESQIENYGNGHINDTYLTDTEQYILQRINTAIFKNPKELMENIENVTSFLTKKIIENGGDPKRETLAVIKTDYGENFYKVDDDNVFRVYRYITDTVSIDEDKSPEVLYNTGAGFGKFQRMLSDFPADTLYETIENFHNTPLRIEALKEAVKNDIAGRAASVQKEIDFALSRADEMSAVVDGIADGSIPLRVTHNDTKINNILFDKNTLEAVCVIDLDTVMPGSALYDFGDALRYGASTAAEDETDLSKVTFSIECFESFARGFLEQTGDSLTEREIELLAFSAKLMTYECGIRFLTDHLNGDTYFKIHRENHNLDRARNHIKLIEDMESKMDRLNSIVKGLMDK
ncbi:MAG: aminoglycoside phosphotransferase family protein [Clostridia bacterium]|nr:aminoglycoside phosphotransferase family protein [Clostridia bacterium]